MADRDQDQMTVNRRALNRKLEATGWGLFFIWTGIALFAHIGWGAGLLGVGIIILGAQAARKYLALKLEGFWVAVGLLFVMGGFWKLVNIQLGLLPILCVVAGAILLVSMLVGGREGDRAGRFGPCLK